VLEACCLAIDLASLPHADRTVIGERGVTLSGGQKQRIALARAAYARPTTLLLDDVLSAVDAPTGRHIFNALFGRTSGLLRHTACILITHATQFAPLASRCLLLHDGEVIGYGSVDELRSLASKAPSPDETDADETVADETDADQTVADETFADETDADETDARRHRRSLASMHATATTTVTCNGELARKDDSQAKQQSHGVLDETVSISSALPEKSAGLKLVAEFLVSAVVSVDAGEKAQQQMERGDGALLAEQAERITAEDASIDDAMDVMCLGFSNSMLMLISHLLQRPCERGLLYFDGHADTGDITQVLCIESLLPHQRSDSLRRVVHRVELDVAVHIALFNFNHHVTPPNRISWFGYARLRSVPSSQTSHLLPHAESEPRSVLNSVRLAYACHSLPVIRSCLSVL
jgi:ABC-type proline/glycine betaine transport system ATPase subunit